MKKKTDPRHIEREMALQEIFAYSFLEKQKIHSKLAENAIKKIARLDPMVSKHAPLWPLPSISPLDLAILRLAIYELKYEKKTPYKVIIDEAVELSKEFGSESTPSFVNGVLGAIVEELGKNNGKH